MMLKLFSKKDTLQLLLEKTRQFREKNRGFIDSEFVKICHEQVD